MSEPIYIHRYEMTSRATLNARSGRRTFPGALIRIGDGYGCLHPWPELGDRPIEEQLDCLSQGTRTRLTMAAQRCAAIDGEARRAGRSLFDGVMIPESHALLSGEEPGALLAEGFRAFKVKCDGGSMADEAERVRGIAREIREAPVARLRIDFNETADAESVAAFLEAVGTSAREHLEFIEDPMPYRAGAWESLGEQCGIPLAVDRCAADASRGVDFLVVKPAVDDTDTLTRFARDSGRKLVFTSYLDHPLGQMFAAREAARIAVSTPVEICGLMTHRVFESDEFIERIESDGPWLSSPGGTGLGFDDLLEALPWTKLS